MKSYEEFEATIKAFPYQAPQPRKDRIIKNYDKLEIGMSKDQVAGLIGEPDYSQPRLGPIRIWKNTGWKGSTWVYYLYKRENSPNNYDPSLDVFFGMVGRAEHILPTNIEGLTEKR